MNDVLAPSSSLLVPAPRRDVAIRVATSADLPFLDRLQKLHGKQIGWFPTQQFEGYVSMGAVLIAQDGSEPLGYCISRDRYLKRDELGVIYQLCVAPGDQRKLIGAALVRVVFERSAYGCKLYCCWCAQDIAANYFWESMGFLPVAFRAGSTGKKRVHIFWQRRINADDTTTPYWYPCQTNAGAIRQDRLVFPIPPGVRWQDVQAVAMPNGEGEAKALPKPKAEKREKKPTLPPPKPTLVAIGGLRFAPPAPPGAPKPSRKRAEKAPVKVDPKLVAAARELRDRYLERLNEHRLIAPHGKYEVRRALTARC